MRLFLLLFLVLFIYTILELVVTVMMFFEFEKNLLSFSEISFQIFTSICIFVICSIHYEIERANYFGMI